MSAVRKYFRPGTIEEAARLACEHGDDFRYVAGGTDVLVNQFQETAITSCLIDLSDLKSLEQVVRQGAHLSIGSLLCLDQLANFPEIADEFPVLLDAVRTVASPVIRRTATLGGNLMCENRCSFFNQTEWWRNAVGYCLKCNGDICIATGGTQNCFSKFSSDIAVALISMNAGIRIQDHGVEYRMPLEQLYTGDGVAPRKLTKTALLMAIELPTNQGFRGVFKKLRRRESLDFSSLSTAVSVNRNGRIRVVLGAVDPRPIIIDGTIQDDLHELAKIARKKARIVDNDTYPRLYRKEMIEVFLQNSFQELGLLREKFEVATNE